MTLPHDDDKKSLDRRRKTMKVMHEYKMGNLHSGSENGPVVKNRGQAIAIAMSEARKHRRRR